MLFLRQTFSAHANKSHAFRIQSLDMLQAPPLSDRFAAINTEMGALEDQLSDALTKVPQTVLNCD